jgi:hypothetical protein
MAGDGITLGAAHATLSLAMVRARQGTQSRLIIDIDVIVLSRIAPSLGSLA